MVPGSGDEDIFSGDGTGDDVVGDLAHKYLLSDLLKSCQGTYFTRLTKKSYSVIPTERSEWRLSTKSLKRMRQNLQYICAIPPHTKIPLGKTERDRAPDGNRTRTAFSGHGIFLLLLLLRKPASSVMLSRCSLDYFLTMRQESAFCISRLRLGPPCIVSTPFISRSRI